MNVLLTLYLSRRQPTAYVSPSDDIMSPCTKKLSDLKGKRFKKYATVSGSWLSSVNIHFTAPASLKLSSLNSARRAMSNLRLPRAVQLNRLGQCAWLPRGLFVLFHPGPRDVSPVLDLFIVLGWFKISRHRRWTLGLFGVCWGGNGEVLSDRVIEDCGLCRGLYFLSLVFPVMTAMPSFLLSYVMG